MKLSAIGSMVLVVLAVAWLGSLTFAQLSEERRGPPPGGGEGRPGRGPEQGPPGGEFRPPLHPLMIALDADKDGELSAEEIANASAALKKLDKNADGILNREELRPQGGPQQPGFGGPGNAGPEFGPPGGGPGGPGGQGPMPGGGGPREGGPGRGGFGGPPAGGPGGPGGPDAGPGGPGGGYHLIPRFAVEQMNLTAEQLEQIAELEKETKAKLDKILTPEQQKILEESRPPRPEGQGGPGMPGGPGGPGGGRFGPGGGPRGGPGADQGQGPDRPQRPQRPAS